MSEPTVYAVPCGLSMLDALATERGRGSGGGAEPLRIRTQRWADRLRQGTSDLASWWNEAFDDLDDAQLPWWTTEVSAEASTMAHRLGHAPIGTAARPAAELAAALRGDGHTIALLASDTPRGIAAAVLVAAQLAAGDPTRVRYETVDATRGNDAHHTFEHGALTVVRVVGLAPTAPDGLATGAAGTGLALRAAWHTAHGRRLEVHLSGGFKGALLQTMAMTEVLHSLGETPVSAWYLFDDQTNPTIAEVGLRTFSVGYRTTMEKELTAAAAGQFPRPGEALFEGALWARQRQPGGGYLNGFGLGHLAVLNGSGFGGSDEGPWR